MFTMSPPIVLATAVPNTTTATKLKKPAQMTAKPGERTRVATTVRDRVCRVVKTVCVVKGQGGDYDKNHQADRCILSFHRLAVFEDNALHDVGDLLTFVGPVFQDLEQFFLLDDLNSVGRVFEKIADRA